MTILKRLFNFYIFSNLHVSLAVFSLTKVTLLHYGIDSNRIPLFNFFATFLSYNFIRIYNFRMLQPWYRGFSVKNKRTLFILNLFSLIMTVWLVSRFSLTIFFFLAIFFFLTLFYVVPLNFNKQHPVTFRNIAFIKLADIAFCWAGVTVFIPLYHYGIPFSKTEIILFTQRILLVAAITIPFDIRDVFTDDKALQTLPQAMGILNAKLTGTVFLFLFIVLGFSSSLETEPNFIIESIVAFVSVLFLWRSSHKQHTYYTAFWIEGIPIFWLLLVLSF